MFVPIQILDQMKRNLILFLWVLLTSCNPKPKEYEIIDFRFDRALNESIKNNVISYRIVPLETAEDCYFATSSKIRISGTKIFILDNLLDKRYQILIFNLQGEFISKINSQGRGPKEYVSINDFDVDPNKAIISILDPALKKLINYDFYSNFIDERPLNIYAKELIYSTKVEDNFIVFSTLMSFPIGNLSYDINVYNINNTFLYSSIPFKKPVGIVLGNNIHLFSNNDGVSYIKVNSNEVYEVGSKQTRLKYLLKFSYAILPNEEIENVFMKGKNILNKYIYSIHYFETSNMVLTQFMNNRKPFMGLYNKSNHRSIVFNDEKDPKCGCGVSFKLKGVFENSFIIECDYLNLDKTLNIIDPLRVKCSNSDAFEKIKSEDITSNPILLFIEFKV
jgi:hypothetical protein